MGAKRTGTVVSLALAGALLMAPGAWGKRPRPPDAPPGSVVTSVAPSGLQLYNDYGTPERTFSSQTVVVHYVVTGIDAPSLNDDDRDGSPDYVEQVGEVADVSIAYYRGRGFVAIRPDRGGPDSRPDVYVSRFTPGSFGVAWPATRAEGGAFVVVSQALDPSCTESLGSVCGTVAHELFHLVQFSYAPEEADLGLWPSWVLEGTAAALETRVFPDLADIVSSLQVRRWLESTWCPLSGTSYGAQLLWHYLDERYPRLLDGYLERLGRSEPAGIGQGRTLFVKTFARVSGRPFGPVFGAFAAETGLGYADELHELATIARGSRRGTVAPFAVHYLRLRVPRNSGYRITLTFPEGGGGAEAASVVYRMASPVAGWAGTPRRVSARISADPRTLTFTIPRSVCGSPRFEAPLLVIANGNSVGSIRYRVVAE
jgi:hypothetical protein